jgi:histidinol-phosphate phosphatase family protein
MLKVVMIIGPTGIGKSTICQEYLDQDYIRLNRDIEGGRTLDLVPKMEQLLQQKKNVILDNTHLNPSRRIPFIEAAHNLGATIECYMLDTSKEDTQVNLATRIIQTGLNITDLDAIKKHKSPNIFASSVHFSHWKKFEEPTEDEGFDKIDVVHFERQIPSDYKNKALILDYDGTLRESSGIKNYPLKPCEIEVLPGRKEILEQYQNDGYLLLGASNQSAVGKGEFTYEEACACFDKTNELLGLNIEYLFCPHKSGPISCWCRKPMPGIAIYFIEKYKLDRENTIMIGDQTSDKTFAKRASIQFEEADDFFS